MRFFWITLLVFFTLNGFLVAQEEERDLQTMLLELELRMQVGQAEAPRDLGTLLDHPTAKEKAKSILKEYTLFIDNEIDWHRPLGRKKFLDFYYKNKEQIHFSPLLEAWYVTPVELRNSTYNIRESENSYLELFPTNKNNLRESILRLIEKAKIFPEDKNLLRQKDEVKWLLQQNEIKSFDILEPACNLFSWFKEDESLMMMLDWVDKEWINPKVAALYISRLTNQNLLLDENFEQLVPRYRALVDSLGSVEAMITDGYQKYFNFKKNFFVDEVDYFGRVLSLAEDQKWLQFNAMRDAVATHHPRALFYIAAQIFKYRNKPNKSPWSTETYINWLQLLTKLKIGVQREDGMTSYEPDFINDRHALENFLFYFANRHVDYEWNDNRHYFVNSVEAAANQAKYDRLFRRLNSRNDSIALESYIKLTEGTPAEVIALAEKYKELLRNIHPSLPPLRNNYLEALVQLTDYCKRKKINYMPNAKINKRLGLLSQAQDEATRLQFENSIIASLNLEDITSVEYWGIIHTNEIENALSIGRIVSHFYEANWKEILKNDRHFQLYLKKASLFKKIRASGVCNHYYLRYESMTPEALEKFKNKVSLEVQPDLDAAILQARIKNPTVQLFDNLESSTEQFLALLPSPPDEILPSIFNLFKDQNKGHDKLKIYLTRHRTPQMVPQYFSLLKSEIEVEWVIAQLDEYFVWKISGQLEEQRKEWLKIHRKFNGKLKSIGKYFYQLRLGKLQTSRSLLMDGIASVVNSPYFQNKDKNICLEGLKNLPDLRRLWKLKFDPLLSLKADLQFFVLPRLELKDLKYLPALFNMQDSKLMFDFISQKAEQYPLEEVGAFYNDLFGQKWFENLLYSDSLDEFHVQNIYDILISYLEEVETITEFEEKTIHLHLAQIDNRNRSLKEKILASQNIDASQQTIAAIQEDILAKMEYADIPTALELYDQFSRPEPDIPYNFINQDFGLPLFDLNDPELRELIFAQHQTQTEAGLYRFFLSQFGLDFMTGTGDIDFDKIAKMLRLDLAVPFAGRGGTFRDYYNYGLIKLLELHFNTRLDFHEKLNENQTFYRYNSASRAKAWVDYLNENGYLKY